MIGLTVVLSVLVQLLTTTNAQCPGGYTLAPSGQVQFCPPLSPTQNCLSPYQCFSGFCCSSASTTTSQFDTHSRAVLFAL